jgi:hypothetical protein
MAPPKTADYGALLKKLKKELIESTLASIDKKAKKDQETYYPTDSQLQLLDVCGYKGYIVPLAFRSSIEANQFVDSYVLKKTKFLEQHHKMLAPGIHFFECINSFLKILFSYRHSFLFDSCHSRKCKVTHGHLADPACRH